MDEFWLKKKKKKNAIEINFTESEPENVDGDECYYKYEELLQRVLDVLPNKYDEKMKFKITKPYILVSSNTTKIINFIDVCNNIEITRGHLKKFLSIYMDCRRVVVNSNDELIIRKRLTAQYVYDSLKIYVNTYKKCLSCGSFDTTTKKKDRSWFVGCSICGASHCCNEAEKQFK